METDCWWTVANFGPSANVKVPIVPNVVLLNDIMSSVFKLSSKSEYFASRAFIPSFIPAGRNAFDILSFAVALDDTKVKPPSSGLKTLRLIK